MAGRGTHYERAFELWLQTSGISYVAVDQAKKAQFEGAKLKSFDFIVHPKNRPKLIIDVKGRKLAAATYRKKRLGQSWTTLDDIDGMENWEAVFGADTLGMFVFAYWLYDLERPGDLPIDIGHDGRYYTFIATDLCGYRQRMKQRSQKWNTVFVPAKPFDDIAVPFRQFVGLK